MPTRLPGACSIRRWRSLPRGRSRTAAPGGIPPKPVSLRWSIPSFAFLAVLFLIPCYHRLRASGHLGVPGVVDDVALRVRRDRLLELGGRGFEHHARPVILRVFLVQPDGGVDALRRDLALGHAEVPVD